MKIGILGVYVGMGYIIILGFRGILEARILINAHNFKKMSSTGELQIKKREVINEEKEK